MAEVEEAYCDGMAADRVRWASGDERRFACGRYSIALRCTRGDDESVVNGWLDVHGCCCFVLLLFVGRCRDPRCVISPRR